MTGPIFGGVLLGGRSRRMGQPKQLLELGGRTMIERVVHTLSAEVEEVVLLGDGEVPASLENLPRLLDVSGCHGPMAGILAALHARPEAGWVVAACDLPRLRRAAVNWLLRQRRPEAWAVLPSLDGFVEPLFAIYESNSRALLESGAAGGDYALHRLSTNAEVVVTEAPEALRECWFNANTPLDYATLRAG